MADEIDFEPDAETDSQPAEIDFQPDSPGLLKGALAGKEQDYADAGQRHGVDPNLLMAISMFETGDGTSHMLRTKNNVGGLTIPGTSAYRDFKSTRESIDAMAQTLRRNYLDRGLTTIPQIGAKYAPVGASNDPNKTNGQWPAAVEKNYRMLSSSRNGNANEIDFQEDQPENLPDEEKSLYRQLEKNRVASAEQGVFPKAVPLSESEKWQAHLESQNRERASQNLPPLEVISVGNPPPGVEDKPQNVYESAISKVQEWWDWLNPPQAPTEAYTGGKPPGSLLGSEKDPFTVSEDQPLIQRSLHAWGNLMNSTIRGLTSLDAVASYPIFSIPGVPEGYAAYTLSHIPTQAGELIKEFQQNGPTPQVIQRTLETGGNDFLATMFPVMAHRARIELKDRLGVADSVGAEVKTQRGGETDAEQPSNEKVESGETAQRVETRPESEVTQASGSGDVEREAEGGQTGGLPQEAQEVRDEQAGLEEPSQEEQDRMLAESQQAQLEEAQEIISRGGDELLDAVKEAGGLDINDPENKMLQEHFAPKSKHGQQKFAKPFTGENINHGDLFKADAPGIDGLTMHLKRLGFDVETPSDTRELIDERLRTGKPIHGNEFLGQSLEAASFGRDEQFAMGIRFGDNNVANRILNNVLDAIKAIKKGFTRIPLGAVDTPIINLDTGGAKPPRSNSIFSPDTPPGSDPVPIYATRLDSAFKRWWQRFWPRDLAVQKIPGGSPVITEHQRIIKTNADYMLQFSNTPWWRALRGRSNDEIIETEDQAVKMYRAMVQSELTKRGIKPNLAELTLGDVPANETPMGRTHRLQQELQIQGARQTARQRVLESMPKWFRDIVNYRESRIPIEYKAAEELGVPAPRYTGDPYLARLTNEEGKDVVDLNPKGVNIGKAISETIGAFDNSRVHASMKDGIKEGTQYEPAARAVWLREMNSVRLESTANFVRNLKAKGVLFDSKQAAYNASPGKRISMVRGLGGKTYWSRTPEEAVFLEQNLSVSPRSPLGKIQQLANTYVHNPSLVNPLPHVTKNMLFKYLIARVNNATFRADTAEFARSTPTELKKRFDRVMPFPIGSERLPQLTASEVGTWGEKLATKGMRTNSPSQHFIFQKADPAMRYSLWKDYVRKGMSDQEAANHVWLDLIRYDANSGGMNFWKAIPFNFFVPWRTGTYVTLAKAMTNHPIRTLLFVGAVEYLREIRYRSSGKWTHLPTDYLDAPLAEAVESGTKVKDVRTGLGAAKNTGAIAATTLLFGPGGGQAPSTIKDVMEAFQGDPGNRARVMNMFWGLSQIYNIPREWQGFEKDGDSRHLVNILTSAALSEHSTLKYEPRRLMKWLPEWMPGMQKSQLVKQAEALQAMVESKKEKSDVTYGARHGVARTFQFTPEDQQMDELRRAAGQRDKKPKKSRDVINIQ